MNKIYYLLFLIISSSLLTSCLGDDEYEDYQLWKVENEEYFDKMKDTLDASGVKYYTEIANLPYPTYKILYHQRSEERRVGKEC